MSTTTYKARFKITSGVYGITYLQIPTDFKEFEARNEARRQYGNLHPNMRLFELLELTPVVGSQTSFTEVKEEPEPSSYILPDALSM